MFVLIDYDNSKYFLTYKGDMRKKISNDFSALMEQKPNGLAEKETQLCC